MEICQLCKKEISNLIHLAKHLSKFHQDYSKEDYFNNFILKDKIDYNCPICGNKRNFLGLTGYEKTCGNSKCGHKLRRINGDIKKEILYKNKNYNNRSKRNETMNKVDDNGLSGHEKRNITIKNNNQEKFGVDYYYQTEEFKSKAKLKKKELHNNENYNNPEKRNTTMSQIGEDGLTGYERKGIKSGETLNKKSDEEWNKIINKRKNTCLEIFGVDNVFKSDWFKKYVNIMNKEKYGTDWYCQSEDFKNKSFLSKLEKHNNGNYNNIEQIIESLHEVWKNKTQEEKDGIIKLRRKNNKEKHGDENYVNSEQISKTLIEYFKFLPKSYWDKIYKNKLNNIDSNGLNSFQRANIKAYQTKKKNGTFKSSRCEILFKQLLKQNNIEYIYQYRSDLYNHNCDFYIPKLDLYIELNLNWTHGFEPFDFYNKNHIEKLKELNKKGNELNFNNERKEYYFNVINVWTCGDLEKIETAKKNDLNYLCIYNKKYFEEVIKNLESYKGFICLI